MITDFIDEEAERAVLSCLVSNPDGVRNLGGLVAPEIFANDENRVIFRAVCDVVARNGVPYPDITTVSRALFDAKQMEAAGGPFNVTGLQIELASIEVAKHSIESLWKRFRRREETRIGKALSLGEIDGETAENELATIRAKAQGGKSSTLPLWELDDLLNYKPDETEEIWPGGILSKGERTAIVGAPGIGKSRLTLQAAIATILGKPFLGWPTNGQGLKWLFLQTENSARRLKADLTAMTDHLPEAQRALLRQYMRILNISALDFATICMMDGHPDRGAILATLEKWQPDVVPIDPLRDAGIGDPNKDADMTDTCKGIDSTMRRSNPRRVPLVVHHGRTGAVEASKVFGDDAASFARNSKVLYGWTRSQINVAPAGADWPGVVIFGCGKNNNGPKWEPFAAKLNESFMTYRRLDPDEFDLGEWEEKMASERRKKKTSIEPERVADVLKKAGGELKGGIKSPEGLIQRVRRECKITESEALLAVETAVDKTIQFREIETKVGGQKAKVYFLNPDTKYEK